MAAKPPRVSNHFRFARQTVVFVLLFSGLAESSIKYDGKCKKKAILPYGKIKLQNLTTWLRT